MKRFYLIIFFLLFSLSAQAQMLQAVVGAGGAGGCNPSIEYIGDKTAYTVDTLSYPDNNIFCYAFTASCSGNTKDAYLYHRGTGSESARIGLYAYSAAPPNGESLKAGTVTTAISSSTDKEWATQPLVTAVVKDTIYWMCVLGVSGAYKNYSGSGGSARYSQSILASDLPNTLPAAGWTGPTSARQVSAYITIGP